MSELLLCFKKRESLIKLSASTTGELCKHGSEYSLSHAYSPLLRPQVEIAALKRRLFPPLKTRFHQGKHLFIALRIHKPPLTPMPIHPTNHSIHQVLAVIIWQLSSHSHFHHLPPWQTQHSSGENMKLHTS